MADIWTPEWHSPEIKAIAELADKIDAKLYPGGWVQLLNWSADDTINGTVSTVNNQSTIQSLLTFTPENFIPANTLKKNSILRLRVFGTIGSAAGTATITLGFGLNGTGTSMGASAAQTPATSTNLTWMMEANVNMITNGTSGTGNLFGFVIGASATQTTPFLIPVSGAATTTINTTVANYIIPYGTWSVANAGNTTSIYAFTVEQLN